ncbi:MAG: thymidine kinase [Bacteroidales bacterium]|jgi:thymidine kinase|nr:thymidine kinase [Bacteroidales bacterium]
MIFSEETPEERKPGRGTIEVITGSMFSGKTEELIRRLRRAVFAGQTVEIFKPAIDVRYSETRVVSHDEKSLQSTPVDNASSILLLAGDARVIGIDEAQFFDLTVVEVCNALADRGVRVVVAGLDMDFNGDPFGPMPQIMAIADYITKVHAICVRCGNLAGYSHRKTAESKVVLLGEKDLYEPLCRTCFNSARRKC